MNLRMEFATTPDGLSRRTGARLGCAIVVAGKVTALPTLLAADVTGHGTLARLLLLADVPVAFAALALPWSRWSRRALLFWPVLAMGGLAMTGRMLTRGAPQLLGLFTVSFIFVGVTQRPRTSLVLLPLAVPLWIATFGGWRDDIGLRAPVALGIWVAVAETLAAFHRNIRTLNAELAARAATDPLTGLANRRQLTGAVVRGGDAVLLLDVDHFKMVNDQFGHPAGDKVLAELGLTVQGILRAEDVAVRYGGDEILILLAGSGPDDAVAVVERLQGEWLRLQPGVTVSIGISILEQGETIGEAIAAADRALYAAKADGGGRWSLAKWEGPDIKVP